MPTITVCSRCRSQSCDGGLWEITEIIDTATRQKLLLSDWVLVNCAGKYGKKHRLALMGRAVGDYTILIDPPWGPPCAMKVRKVED